MSLPMTTQDDSHPDVETTNWNAVKLLATKYGIQLRPLEESQVSPAGAMGSSAKGYISYGSEVEDLGVGTPFMITARAMEGGRIIYRFKWRGEEANKNDESVDASSEAGYEPGSDSPASSWGKNMGKKKQASSRTLKSKASLPMLQAIGLASGTPAVAAASSSSAKKRQSTTVDEQARHVAPRIERGDVLGAILGLRSGITAQDYAWAEMKREAESSSTSAGKGKTKGKRRRPEDQLRGQKVNHSQRLEPAWQSPLPFGEPVLKSKQDYRTSPEQSWQKSPIPRMADLGVPFFSDVDTVFQTSGNPSQEQGHSDDITLAREALFSKSDEDTIIFDVLRRYGLYGIDPLDAESARQSPARSPPRTRQPSSSSGPPTSPTGSEVPHPMTSSVTATPSDDPRFALWAIRSGEDDDALVLSSRDGFIDATPSTPQIAATSAVSGTAAPGTPASTGKRFSVRNSTSTSSSMDSAQSPGGLSTSQQNSKHFMLFPSDAAFLLAASPEYIVAELTSRIDSRFLTDFLYTYRAYLSGEELLRLLILRFKWASTPTCGQKEEARRKIVRVRTYVVIKYWLTNFFEVDFVPNRVLRKQLTDWLNSAGQDEQLFDQSIIKSLKKLVRSLKMSYEQLGVGGILLSEPTQSPERMISNSHRFDGAEGGGGRASSADGKVTLEWDQQTEERDGSATPSARDVAQAAAGGLSSGDRWQGSSSIGSASPAALSLKPPPPLPLSQNPLSRAFVNTVGRLSRLKRNINSRNNSGVHASHSSESGGLEDLELEANDGGDLLSVRGGVDTFLRFFNLEESQEKIEAVDDEHTSDSTTAPEETPSLSTASRQTSSTPASSIDLDADERRTANGAGYGLGISHGEGAVQLDAFPQALLSDEMNHLTHANLAKTSKADLLHHFQSDQTLRSVSTAQAPGNDSGAERSPARQAWRKTGRFSAPRGPSNIVQIDDIDLSSDEDDGMVRRALRRLPGARDLRMANHVYELGAPNRGSFDSVSASSLGKAHSTAHRSINSFHNGGGSHWRSSTAMDSFGSSTMAMPTHVEVPQEIHTVQTEMLDPDEALKGYELVKGFRPDFFDSDDEEPGDVEAALRRLEGFIDEDKQKEKQRKVESMWLRSQAQRQQDEAEVAERELAERAQNRQSAPSVQQGRERRRANEDEQLDRLTEGGQSSAPSMSPTKADVRKAKTQTAMPSSVARRAGGVATGALRAQVGGRHAAAAATAAFPARLWTPSAPVHRSFLLNYRSEIIAQQFCLIESELFRSVTWQELVSEQWKHRQYTGQVLDWETFYQASVRKKAESEKAGKRQEGVANVEAIVARFNLTCNWVASEIVLTRHIDDRAAVICKLVRIAWKCYHHSNFATLTQIILGLQSPWVERLSKTWSRVGMLEMRMLRDLKAFINPARNFKHLRTSMRNMIIEGGMEDLITSAGPPRGGNVKGRQSALHLNGACIPFFGLFLSDLAINDTLPTLIAPSSSATNGRSERRVDWSANSTTAAPAMFAHLPPLPDKVELSPLINLYKYRIIALTVKSVLAFQGRLDSYQFQADAPIYVKTLRIRCLEGEQLTQISHLVEP